MFSIKLCIFSNVVGAHKNNLIETVLLSTHNKCFGGEIRNFILCVFTQKYV